MLYKKTLHICAPPFIVMLCVFPIGIMGGLEY